MKTRYTCAHCGAESPNIEACSSTCRTALVHSRAGAPARWMIGALGGCDDETQKEIVFRALGIVEMLRRLCDAAPIAIREHVARTAAAGVFAHCLAQSTSRQEDAASVTQAVNAVLVAHGLADVVNPAQTTKPTTTLTH